MTGSIAPTPRPDPFEAFVCAHQAMVWRYLRFLGCDPDRASELTQDTFVSVFGKDVHTFGEAGARAYLRRVARNAFLKQVTSARQRDELDFETAVAAYDWYRRDDEGESAMAALDACLEELGAKARRALSLRFGEKLDRNALAERLGIGAHGVKSLLQRSYARLRVCIERRLRDA